MNLSDRPPLDQVLLNDWQHDFPLSPRPFSELARECGQAEDDLLDSYRRLLREGSISRIGGVWGAGAGGWAMLCAQAVPPERLQTVAQQVSAFEGVNHNYEREHRYNLWFVITGRTRETVHEQVDRIEALTGLGALRLPMVRPYRIDLGFDLRQTHASPHPDVIRPRQRERGQAVPLEEQRLAELVEEGLPLIAEPYAAWAASVGWPLQRVLNTLNRWLESGTLRRFGVVVRHHDLGICANAMTVINVADELVDRVGIQLAAQRGITLCYRRERHLDWPYNLYFMVHGQDRDTVQQLVSQALNHTRLNELPHQTLFSGQRFKQTGGRYFRATSQVSTAEMPHDQPA